MLLRFAVLITVVGLAACQTSPQLQELRTQNQTLEQQLAESQQRITSLEAEARRRQENVNELSRVMSILEEERDSRSSESSDLRREVRSFVQGQIDALRTFLVRSELLDYIGDELVDRRKMEVEPLLLVDTGNPVPRNGTLTGVGAHLDQASSFRVKVLRPIGEELVVIWESGLVTAAQAGFFRQQFPVSVGVEKGDLIAYYFPEKTGVSFDEGTGSTLYAGRDVALGESLRRRSLDGEEQKRAYSLGVFGLLNLQ